MDLPYVVRLEFKARQPMSKPFAQLITTALLYLACSGLYADDFVAPASDWSIERWTYMASVYTRHFDPEPDHENDQHLLSVEAGFSNNWLLGAAVFDNSYGQNSQFVYIGKRWQISDSDYWYAKLRGGLLHGYKEPYDDKIPLNGLGVAPAVIPSLGFQYRNFVSELSVAGTAAAMITVGFEF